MLSGIMASSTATIELGDPLTAEPTKSLTLISSRLDGMTSAYVVYCPVFSVKVRPSFSLTVILPSLIAVMVPRTRDGAASAKAGAIASRTTVAVAKKRKENM